MAASGFEKYTLSNDTQIAVSQASKNRTLFAATQEGNETSDGPTDALNLTQLQLARTLTLYYSNVSSFNLTFSCTDGNAGGVSGNAGGLSGT